MKQLAGQTAVYGLSSILGRFINFLLVPLQTAVLTTAEYGYNVDFYSLIAFLIVVLTFGMETAFFRFSQKEHKTVAVFNNSSSLILVAVGIFTGITLLLEPALVGVLRWESHPAMLKLLLAVLALDALSAIPFARLRLENKAWQFAGIKMALIGANVLLNLYFYLPVFWESKGITPWFNHDYRGVELVFWANLIASVLMFLLLIPAWRGFKFSLNKKIALPLLKFGWPLLVGGLAGIANEVLDRQLLKYLLPVDSWESGVGQYGGVYKISIFLVLFNQAFRYAAEPFFFKSAEQKDSPQTFAKILRLFTWLMSIGFVTVIAGLDILKFFIDSSYWSALYIVPVLLLANVILGVNTNLSIWYKLVDKTAYGIKITGVGLAFTIILNFLLIPIMGIMGAAIATLASYTAMTVVSALWGNKHYPIPYPWRRIVAYIATACVVVMLTHYVVPQIVALKIGIGLLYIVAMIVVEKQTIRTFIKP